MSRRFQVPPAWRPVCRLEQGVYDVSEERRPGNANEARGLRPGQPTEMRSAVPSHVTSVTATTTATIAIVRRRGMPG